MIVENNIYNIIHKNKEKKEKFILAFFVLCWQLAVYQSCL